MRKLMWFALAFAGGTGLCQYLLPAAWQAWAGAAALLLGLGLSSLWREKRRIVRLLAFGLAAGILWFAAYSALFLTPAEARVGTEETVTLQQISPQYQGALVVCSGGGNPSVRLQVVEAVSALTGLGADHISVCEGK